MAQKLALLFRFFQNCKENQISAFVHEMTKKFIYQILSVRNNIDTYTTHYDRDGLVESIQFHSKSHLNLGSFYVNSTRQLNPPSAILTKLGVYITPTLIRNYARYFFPKPHSFVYRRDQDFKISPLLTIF